MSSRPPPPKGKAGTSRAWQRMLSGRRLDLLDPSPLDVEIEDIAHGLSRVARWNGQTSGSWAYSVAQHSVLVEEIFSHLKPAAPPQEQLAALLHDGPEYVVGDMITPFKAVIGADYKTVEHRLQIAIHLRFGLPGTTPIRLVRAIKKADKIAAYFEATQLAGFTPSEAARLFGKPGSGPDVRIVPIPPDEAKERFMIRFSNLA